MKNFFNNAKNRKYSSFDALHYGNSIGTIKPVEVEETEEIKEDINKYDKTSLVSNNQYKKITILLVAILVISLLVNRRQIITVFKK